MLQFVLKRSSCSNNNFFQQNVLCLICINYTGMPSKAAFSTNDTLDILGMFDDDDECMNPGSDEEYKVFTFVLKYL